MRTYQRILAFSSIGALAVAAYAYQTAHRLTLDGNVISTSVTYSNGHYLVPVEDVAKAIGAKLTMDNRNPVLTRDPASGVLLPPTPGATLPAATASEASQSIPAVSGVTPPVAVTDGPLSNGNSTLPSGNPLTTAAPSMISANSGIVPSLPQQPVKVDALVGKATRVGDFSYTVDSIHDVGSRYKLVYDQTGETIHPTFRADSLVVVNLTVTNVGTGTHSPSMPGMADICVFDSDKVGYPAGYLDQRQSSSLVNSGSDNYDIAPYVGGATLVLAPGGSLRYAAIASVPGGAKVTNVTLRLSNSSMDNGTTSATTMLTVAP